MERNEPDILVQALRAATEEEAWRAVLEWSDGRYPWFRVVEGAVLEQGDILPACPVVRLLPPVKGELAPEQTIEFEDRDVIVITQTCDMVLGREKVT